MLLVFRKMMFKGLIKFYRRFPLSLFAPPINPYTEILHHSNGLVLVVHLQKGVSKPYMDNNAVVWIKSGSDTVKVTSREEIQRMFQSASLIHRDYFISAPIRIFVFSDRIEITSPGHLPNNLSRENIKSGYSNFRNPILSSFATRIILYLGSGVQRIRT